MYGAVGAPLLRDKFKPGTRYFTAAPTAVKLESISPMLMRLSSVDTDCLLVLVFVVTRRRMPEAGKLSIESIDDFSESVYQCLPEQENISGNGMPPCVVGGIGVVTILSVL